MGEGNTSQLRGNGCKEYLGKIQSLKTKERRFYYLCHIYRLDKENDVE